MRFEEFAEDNFGTHPRRPARTGARHPRGHEPVERYKTVKTQMADAELDEGWREKVAAAAMGAAALGGHSDANAIAGAIPTPSHQQAMYKAMADSNRAQARADAAAKVKADAERLKQNTELVDKEQRVNHHRLNEFAPDEGGGSRKFIPWTEFIEQVKQIVGKDFSCKENIVKSTIKARFIPHDPMEYGPTMLYSYYETRAGGRNKGAVSTRGSIQVGKYTKGGLFGHAPDQLLTSFSLLKGHPFERHFDLTFDNIYKIANIIKGNTQGALEFQPQQQVNEFAPASNPGGGNYLQALASAWYNGTFNTGDLHKGIKSQEDVENILARGIHCGDGKIRKYSIGYNADFDGVEIQSDDHYEYSDYDDAGNDIDSRTGQPWGPYDVVEFSDNELDEGVAKGSLDEKSTSQAQFRTMAAAAHNPAFAKKVGIKQSVAKEFNKADKGQSYKSLPKKA